MLSPRQAEGTSGKCINELCIMDDEIPRNGGRLPEYASTLFICIDRVLDGIVSGHIWSFCRNQPAAFTDLGSLLLILDDMLDEMETPERWCKLHTVGVQEKTKPAKRTTFAKLCFRPSDLEGIQGKIDTVAIRVYMRRNASLQGVLRFYGDVSADITFRSALELLHLLHRKILSTTRRKSYGYKRHQTGIRSN